MKRTLRKTRTPRRISPWIAQAVLGTGVLVAVSFSCARSPVQSPLAVILTAPDAPTGPEKVDQPHPSDGPPVESYAEAIRRRQFDVAAELIDAATEDEQSTPEVRYARALVALELGDVETALRKIDHLEMDFPAFSAEAKQVREEAARRSRDVTLMGALVESTAPGHQLLIAEAYEHNESLVEARRLADAVIAKVEQSKKKDDHLLSARAHALRARTLEAEGKKSEAARELLWLAVHAPSIKPEEVGLDRAIDEKLSDLDDTVSLTPKERLARARAFSDRGLVQETEEEMKLLRESGHTPAESAGLIAWALYASRSDYERAARMFVEAARAEPEKRVEYLYYEAKSLARAHRDDEAIKKYDHVAQLGGRFSDHARYQAARLRMIEGRFAEAAKGFSSYLAAYGAGARHRDDANYSLAIAHLASENYAFAVTKLGELYRKTTSERTRAQLLELKGVGLLGAKKLPEAAATFRQVIEQRPLSLSALLAMARLRQMNESLPPLVPPAPALVPKDGPDHPLKLNLPEKSWRLNRVGLDSQAEEALREEERAIRVKYGERSGEALCETYGLLQSAERRYQIAQSAARWDHLRYAPTATTRWEWNCIYPAPYDVAVETEAKRRNVPVALIYAVMRQESAFRPQVISPARAVGLMQIIPPTAARIAEEIGAEYQPDAMNSPSTNIEFGTYYLRRLLDMFGNRYELAAASYNAGPHAVTNWLRAGENLPLDVFVATIPYEETRNYVYRVMGNYARYAYLDDTASVPLFELDIPKGLEASADAY